MKTYYISLSVVLLVALVGGTSRTLPELGKDYQEVNLEQEVSSKKRSPIKLMSQKEVKPLDIEDIVRREARRHDLSEDYMVGVAACESGLGGNLVNENYTAGGGHPTGIFQFLPETWQRIGSQSPYGVGDVMNTEDNIKVASWAFANGFDKEWACA